MNCCPCCPRIGKKNKGKLYFIRYSTFFKKLFILSLRLKKVKLTLKNAACCMTAIEKYLRKNNFMSKLWNGKVKFASIFNDKTFKWHFRHLSGFCQSLQINENHWNSPTIITSQPKPKISAHIILNRRVFHHYLDLNHNHGNSQYANTYKFSSIVKLKDTKLLSSSIVRLKKTKLLSSSIVILKEAKSLTFNL
jgi:hypothetical protein